MRLKLRRAGTFTAHWKDTHNMCGTNPTTTPTYKYVCEIECAPLLDGNGFIVDQLDIDKYFQNKYAGYTSGGYGHKARSCEDIAILAIRDVKHMVESHMTMNHGLSQIYRIAITISLMENAAMTAEWSPENESAERNSKIGTKSSRKTRSPQRVSDATNSVPSTEEGKLPKRVDFKRGRDSGVKSIPLGTKYGRGSTLIDN